MYNDLLLKLKYMFLKSRESCIFFVCFFGLSSSTLWNLNFSKNKFFPEPNTFQSTIWYDLSKEYLFYKIHLQPWNLNLLYVSKHTLVVMF